MSRRFASRGLREHRTLSQKGFEVANGLPFVAADCAVHDLLAAHTVAEAQALQVALGKIRRASGHFPGKVLAIDPHRIRSYTKRQMRRHRFSTDQRAEKMSQTFFCLDAQSHQPVCFTLASAARSVGEATPEMLSLAQSILNPSTEDPLLVLADTEHYNTELIDHVALDSPFDLLVPMRSSGQAARQSWERLPESAFERRWAGFATAKVPYRMSKSRSPSPYYQMVQRSRERREDYQYEAFLSTADRPEVDDLSLHYPQRWHIEEFFKFNQALGWQRAGTLNLNIRYAQMTFALIAQAAIAGLRQRLGEPFKRWDAEHLARHLFGGLEGDVRVKDDQIVVTYYNAPQAEALAAHYQDLPSKLSAEGVDPRISWLYDFKLDFRFR